MIPAETCNPARGPEPPPDPDPSAMNPIPIHTMLACCCALVPFLSLCAAARSQDPAPDAALAALLAKIDAAYGTPPENLRLCGEYAVRFAGTPGDKPVAQGKWIEIFAGAERARMTIQMGEYGANEKGLADGVIWEVEPMLGARIYAPPQARVARRYLALLRGASPKTLYRHFERTGTDTVDGRACTKIKMTPESGKADTWYVDADGRALRIDIALPVPESADVVAGDSDFTDAWMTFGDWKQVGGRAYAHRRIMHMGPATIDSTLTAVETPDQLADALFAPPQSVLDKKKQAPAGTGEGGVPEYQIVERQVQPVASIRTKCKPDQVSATLAVLLPEVMAHLNATGAKMSGPPFSRYHTVKDGEIDIEAGIPVTKPIEPKGRVANSELPAGRTASAWHIGPYEKLGQAHAALRAWVAAQKATPRGGAYEVYWTDPGMVPDPAKWRTQLFQPIE